MSSSSKIELSIPLHLYFVGDSAINLNSPRLREACKIQEIEPQELVPKSLNDIREMYKEDHLNREALILATQHYEERREAKVKIILSERDRIIEEDNKSQRNHPDGKRVPRLFTLTGKVTKRTLLPETLKERRLLREMVVRQQREIDEVLFNLQHGNPVARNLYRERLLKERAENAHYERYDGSAERIEVITNEDFRRATVGGGELRGSSKENVEPLSHSYIKPWKKANGRNGSERRKQQRLVYAKEIMRFMDEEKKNKERERKNKKVNYLSFLRRQKGNYLDHQYVWREDKHGAENKRSRAIRNFYDDQLKHIEEEEAKISPPNGKTQAISVSKHAREESKKWLKSHKQALSEHYSQNHAESERKLKPAEAFFYGGSKHKVKPVQKFLESSFTRNLLMVNSIQSGLGSLCAINLYNACDSSDEEEDSARTEKNNRNKSISSSWAKSRGSPEAYEESIYAKNDDYHKMLQLRSDRTSSTDFRGTGSGFTSMRSTGMMNTFGGTWNSKSSNIFSSPRVSSGILRDTQRSFKESNDQFRSSKTFSTKNVKFQGTNSDDIAETMKMAKLGIQISKDDEAYQIRFEEMYRERERHEHLRKMANEGDKKYMRKVFDVERSKANNAMSQYEELKSTLSKHLGPVASHLNY